MCAANHNDRGLARLKLALISLFILPLLVAALWRASHFMRSMSVVAGSAKELQQAKADAKTKIVVEVTDADANGLIHGTILEKKTEELYARTKVAVTAQSSKDTKWVMGKREDAHKAAVIHISGYVRPDRKIDAEQIVILTGYVKVQ